jgi:hypothetical protein
MPPGEQAVSDSREPEAGALRSLPALLWARAHHEAAHAVAATLLGGRVAEMELWSGPPVGGRVRMTGLDADSGRTDSGRAGGYGLVRHIVYLLAGPIAEHIAEAGPAPIQNDAASLIATALMMGLHEPGRIELHPDVQAVVGLLQAHFGPDDETGSAAAVDHLAMHVENYVTSQWAAIQSVAASLLRHGRLTGDQLDVLFTTAMPAPELAALLDEFPA